MNDYACFVPHYDNVPYDLFDQVALDCKDGDIIIEVGAFFGHATCYLAAALAAANKRPRFYALDIWDQQIGPEYGETRAGLMPWGEDIADWRARGGRLYDSFRFYLDNCPHRDRVFDHAQFPPGTCMDEFTDNSVSFVYLGYSKTEEQIDREVKQWWPRLKSGGQIAIQSTETAPMRGMLKE